MDRPAANSDTFWQRQASQFVVQPFAVAVSKSAIPVLMADATADDLPIVFVNDAFLRLGGWEQAEVLGRTVRFPLTDPAEAARVTGAIAAGVPVSEDVVLTRRDGTLLTVRLDIAPVFDPSGRPSVMFATLVDVSDRVEALRRRDVAQRRLAERTSELEDELERSVLLSREITHRTKNALAILGALVSLKARRARDARETALLADIAGRIHAIGGLQALLDGLKSETDGVLLSDILARLVSDLDQSTEARVVLTGAPHTCLAADDALALALCVTELVLNAQKHGFADGRTGTITVSAQTDPNGCTVVVEDDGQGIDPGFDPAASDGLGMHVLLDQVARLDGRLVSGRSPAGGARFGISFPA